MILLGCSGKFYEVVDLVCYYLLDCLSYIIGIIINVVGGKIRG